MKTETRRMITTTTIVNTTTMATKIVAASMVTSMVLWSTKELGGVSTPPVDVGELVSCTCVEAVVVPTEWS